MRPAISAFEAKNLPLAEQLARQFLLGHPDEPNALKLMGDIAWHKRDPVAAEPFFARCVALAPDSTLVRYGYARVLIEIGKVAAAKEQTEELMRRDPKNLNHIGLMAYLLGQMGEYSDALPHHEAFLRQVPNHRAAWLAYSSDLRAAGRLADAIAALREAIKLDPSGGEAYWNLANLKTFRFSEAEIASMQEQIARSGPSPLSRTMLHFALAKAIEDSGRYEEAFALYRKGNALQRTASPYDPDLTTRDFRRVREIFTADFLRQRAGMGDPSPAPIFVMGLPRAGSTLTEQILSSHSLIEGTRELPAVQSIAGRVKGGFPEGVVDMSGEALKTMGEEYLGEAALFRKTGRPFFIDKMPSNFPYTGLIHLILPNAKIVDVRRHPLDCGLANFKQIFPRAFGFTYDLESIGRYYRDYVNLMSHFDAVLPGKVHRVIYERLVEDPESEIRSLLDYVGVPFEQGCLEFHRNRRAVRTASSEQVRMPIFKSSIGSWRKYESHVQPLIQALGPVLSAYPRPPATL